MSVFTDPSVYPGISLHDPYSRAVRLSAMGLRGKRIETRKQRFLHAPCDVVIVASLAQPDPDDAARVRGLLVPDRVTEAQWDAAEIHGKAIVLAKIVECRPLTVDDFHDSLWWNEEQQAIKPRWAYIMDNLRLLRPIKVRAHQGWYAVARSEVDAAIL